MSAEFFEILENAREAFDNTEVQATPRDPYGPFRFSGKVIGVKLKGAAVELSVRVLHTIDAKWQQGMDATIYFHPEEKKWSLSRNFTKKGELMVEKLGTEFLKNRAEYEKYNLAVTGDEVRRLLMRFSPKLVFHLPGEAKPVAIPKHLDSAVDAICKGPELRYFVRYLLDTFPRAFASHEREMLERHLSEYKLFM